jgi:N-acetylglucosamine kinase-like BadF-type ATPase
MPTGVTAGVDLGGTRIRVLATGSSANWSRSLEACAPTPAALPEFLARLWRRWGLSPGDVEALVVAARGIWTSAERRGYEAKLRGLAKRVRVISDAEAAFLGALGAGSGLLVLAGTGSIVLGRNRRGRWGRAGGLGPLLGDEGSAFWIGREWLRATARSRNWARMRALARAPDAVARVAALAPAVLQKAETGHNGARAIVAAAQGHLSSLARRLARQLRLTGPVRVSWAGGLLENRNFRDGLRRALRRQGIRARLVAPAHPGVKAAHAMAIRLAHRAAP